MRQSPLAYHFFTNLSNYQMQDGWMVHQSTRISEYPKHSRAFFYDWDSDYLPLVGAHSSLSRFTPHSRLREIIGITIHQAMDPIPTRRSSCRQQCPYGSSIPREGNEWNHRHAQYPALLPMFTDISSGKIGFITGSFQLFPPFCIRSSQI